jgi:serine/threonine-protein kinase
MITADYTGTILDGKFEVIRLLGEGGMGAVYLARHKTINKPVAIKFLHAQLAEREDVVKRFYREAQAAAAIRHNNIIDVMDLGMSPKGEPYIVMEYLEGEGLGDRIEQEGPLSLPAASGIVEAALLALEAAHDKGIVHRDLKPDNIFLVHRKGELPGVKLIDFGISKFVAVRDQTKLTQDGSMLGTPAYMSPEQARGLENVDHRTDLYAMGVILYEILTGDVPFKGATYSELLLNMLTEEPRDPLTVNANFPEAARPVLTRALKKNPNERYQRAPEMLEAIRALSTLEDRVRDLSVLSSYLETKSAAKHQDVDHIGNSDTQISDDLLQEMISRRSKTTPSSNRAVSIVESAKRKLTILVQNGEAMLETLEKRGVLNKIKFPYRWFMKKTEHRPKVRTGAAFLLGFLAVVLTFALCSEGDVTIAVNGAPRDATIYFNGEKMTGNPFDADYSEDPLQLRVETPGRQAFEISIIPSRNQTIDVRFPEAVTDSRPQKKKSSTSKSTTVDRMSPAKKEAAVNPPEMDKGDDNAAENADADTDGEKSTKKKPRRGWRNIFR